MNKMIDSIIFDVDGTIWDSRDAVARAWNEVFTAEHVNLQVDVACLTGYFGQMLPDIARQLLPDYPEDEQMRIIGLCCEEEHRKLYAEGAPAYDGLEDTLKKLSARYPLFVVSNCQAGYIELVLEKTGFGSYFTGHLCPGDTGKAKAYNIRAIADKYNLKAPVYIGDTDGDHQACKEAKIPFVYASYGFGHTDDPDYVIHKPTDLLSLFL